MPNFHSASVSHVGMVRQLNEDSFMGRDDVGLWAVADGMGGHQSGDVASQQVVACLGDVSVCPDIASLLRATRMAINEANSRLYNMSSQYDSGRVPGSTVAALILNDRQAAVIWAGDSRIYRLRNGQAEQITRDHSHVQELLDQQLISPEEAESHPMANVITRAVGIEEYLELDVLHFELMEGDRFLLCSDGMSRLVSLDEIQAQMQRAHLEETVQSLLHTVLVRGASDNVTIVTVESVESGGPAYDNGNDVGHEDGHDDDEDEDEDADVTRIMKR